MSEAAGYAVDGLLPAEVVRPSSLAALGSALNDANRADQAVVLQGGRTAMGIGNVAHQRSQIGRFPVECERTRLGKAQGAQVVE